jgi:hypothetical protein
MMTSKQMNSPASPPPAPESSYRASWFERNPKKALFFLFVFFMTLIFSVSEVFLRISKTKDYDNPYEFIEVAREVLEKGLPITKIKTWYTDHEGVYKANREFDWGNGEEINRDGFRSIEFKLYETKMKKILFLGDSFTWGGNAKPIQKCFVDQVGKAGYLVFNTGIPGAAPNQYAFLGEKYVPLLKPDIVMTMICMSNDINLAPQPMVPDQDLFHTVKFKNTTTMFYAFDDNGNYITPEDCLRQAIRVHENRGSAVQRVCRWVFTRSMVGTRIWWSLSNIKNTQLSFVANHEPETNLREKNQYVIDSLKRISDVCRRYHAEPMVFLIPVKPSADSLRTNIAKNLPVFAGFKPLFPHNLTDADYDAGGDDAHLNNEGHRKLAQFIREKLSEQGY